MSYPFHNGAKMFFVSIIPQRPKFVHFQSIHHDQLCPEHVTPSHQNSLPKEEILPCLRSVELGERFWQMSFALQQGRQVATRAVLQHQHQTFAARGVTGAWENALETTAEHCVEAQRHAANHPKRSKTNEGLGMFGHSNIRAS